MSARDQVISLLNFFFPAEEVDRMVDQVAQSLGITPTQVYYSYLGHIKALIHQVICKPIKYDKRLKIYQETAVLHMLQNPGLIAAFEVGTGKTLTAVITAKVFITLALKFKKPIQVIIVTPATLVDNMKEEIRLFNTNPKLIGSGYVDPEIKVITTAKFANDYKRGKLNCRGSVFIVDEAHKLKADYRNLFAPLMVQLLKGERENTQAEQGVKCAAQASKVLLLTATPIPNDESDIVNLISMVDGVYPPYGKEYKNLELYRNKIMFQDADLSHFPRKEEHVLEIEMTPEVLNKYVEIEQRIKAQKKFKGENEKKLKNAFMNVVRQSSNKIEPCLKCMVAFDLILEASRNNEKVLLYSEYLSSGIDMIENILNQQNVPYYIIKGDTNPNQRPNIIRAYNAEKGFAIMIVTQAAGLGMDLKEVENVIIFEPTWNLSTINQVIGRSWRYESHVDLPPERQRVKIYHLLLVKPLYIGFESYTIHSQAYLDQYDFLHVQVLDPSGQQIVWMKTPRLGSRPLEREFQGIGSMRTQPRVAQERVIVRPEEPYPTGRHSMVRASGPREGPRGGPPAWTNRQSQAGTATSPEWTRAPSGPGLIGGGPSQSPMGSQSPIRPSQSPIGSRSSITMEDKAGSDVYMFLNSLRKQEELDEFEQELRQVSLQPGAYGQVDCRQVGHFVA